MKTSNFFPRSLITAILATTLPALAQTSDPSIWNPATAPIPVVQTVTLTNPSGVTGIPYWPTDFGIVRALPGSTVRLELGSNFAGATNIVWYAGTQEIGRTAATNHLDLSNFREPFHPAGPYYATFDLLGQTTNTGATKIVATPFSSAPLLNLSTRATLSPASPSLTSGFVVGNDGTPAGLTRQLLIRAVGPTLATYNVTSPVADPDFDVYDAAGHRVSPDPGWGFSTDITYDHYLQLVSASVGAFPVPITSATQTGSTGEPVRVYRLPTGAYTVIVKSASGGSGEVLLEIYETKGLQGPLMEIVVPVPTAPTT